MRQNDFPVYVLHKKAPKEGESNEVCGLEFKFAIQDIQEEITAFYEKNDMKMGFDLSLQTTETKGVLIFEVFPPTLLLACGFIGDNY